MRRRSSAAARGERRSPACSPTAATRSRSPAATRSRRARSPRRGRNPRYLRTRRPARRRRGDARPSCPPTPTSVRRRRAEPRRSPRSPPPCPAAARCSALTKGLDPATGARLSTLVRERPVAVLSGPNMAEEIADGLPSAAVIASEDEALAVELQHAINSTGFRVYVNPDLDRRRALRRREERDRARRGRGRRPRARRQREGRADHPRAGRDGAARRGVRRAAGDLRRARRHGRPDRHLLEPPRPQPAARAS